VPDWRSYRSCPGQTDEPRAAVLVHGSPGDSHAMHAVARALQVQGIGAYALDMRGHGACGPCCHLTCVGQIDDDLAVRATPWARSLASGRPTMFWA